MSTKSVSVNATTTWVESFNNLYKCEAASTLQLIIVYALTFFTGGAFYLCGRVFCACLDSVGNEPETGRALSLANQRISASVQQVRTEPGSLSQVTNRWRDEPSRYCRMLQMLINAQIFRCERAQFRLDEMLEAYRKKPSSFDFSYPCRDGVVSHQTVIEYFNKHVEDMKSEFSYLSQKSEEWQSSFKGEPPHLSAFKTCSETLEKCKLSDQELKSQFEQGTLQNYLTTMQSKLNLIRTSLMQSALTI